MEFYRIDALCVPRENGVLTHAKFLTWVFTRKNYMSCRTHCLLKFITLLPQVCHLFITSYHSYFGFHACEKNVL
jgi:hypothetical protein